METPLYYLSRAESRVECGMAEAEYAQLMEWRAAGASFGAIERTMREAAEHPEVFIPLATVKKSDAVEYAERAAAADLAVRLSLAEGDSTHARVHRGDLALPIAARLGVVRRGRGGASERERGSIACGRPARLCLG